MQNWYSLPLDMRAPHGGELAFNDKEYKGGEFMPYYIPRTMMPQIDEADYPDFLAFVRSKGVSIQDTCMIPTMLKGHQRMDVIDPAKMPLAVRSKPVLVSADYLVLDGNHRWLIHLMEKSPVPSLILGLTFASAIELMFQFPKTYTLGQSFERN